MVQNSFCEKSFFLWKKVFLVTKGFGDIIFFGGEIGFLVKKVYWWKPFFGDFFSWIVFDEKRCFFSRKKSFIWEEEEKKWENKIRIQACSGKKNSMTFFLGDNFFGGKSIL